MTNRDDRVLVIDDAARERLRRFIAETGPKIAAENAVMRAEGAKARAAGVPISGCPHHIGSYVATRWFEGWSGTLAPVAFCHVTHMMIMRPPEHVAAFVDWVMTLGLPDAMAAKMIAAIRGSYSAQALTAVQ